MILSLSSTSHRLTSPPPTNACRVAPVPLLHLLLLLPPLCPLSPSTVLIALSCAGRGLLRALFPPCSSALPALGIQSCRTRPPWSTSPPGLGRCCASRVFSSRSSTHRSLFSSIPPPHPKVWDSYTRHLDSPGEAGAPGEERQVAAVARVALQAREAAPGAYGAPRPATGEEVEQGALVAIPAAGITRWTRCEVVAWTSSPSCEFLQPFLHVSVEPLWCPPLCYSTLY